MGLFYSLEKQKEIAVIFRKQRTLASQEPRKQVKEIYKTYVGSFVRSQIVDPWKNARANGSLGVSKRAQTVFLSKIKKKTKEKR